VLDTVRLTASELRRRGESAFTTGRTPGEQVSRGYPRAVNNLAIQALLAAFAQGKAIVDEHSTRTAVTEVTTE
jgi:type II secretory pathway predicted ATPase ExeA